MGEYTNSFDDLRGDIMGVFDSLRDMTAAQTKLNELMHEDSVALWRDQAALRDDLHGLSNRVESLTRAVMTDPDDTAVAIVKALRLTKPYDQDAS